MLLYKSGIPLPFPSILPKQWERHDWVKPCVYILWSEESNGTGQDISPPRYHRWLCTQRPSDRSPAICHSTQGATLLWAEKPWVAWKSHGQAEHSEGFIWTPLGTHVTTKWREREPLCFVARSFILLWSQGNLGPSGSEGKGSPQLTRHKSPYLEFACKT